MSPPSCWHARRTWCHDTFRVQPLEGVSHEPDGEASQVWPARYEGRLNGNASQLYPPPYMTASLPDH